MVYGGYNSSIHGLYKPSHLWGPKPSQLRKSDLAEGCPARPIGVIKKKHRRDTVPGRKMVMGVIAGDVHPTEIGNSRVWPTPKSNLALTLDHKPSETGLEHQLPGLCFMCFSWSHENDQSLCNGIFLRR